MNFNIFENKIDADEAIATDNASFLESICEGCAEYRAITSRWDEVRQRDNDGKWLYAVCPVGSQDHTQEELQSDWFTEE